MEFKKVYLICHRCGASGPMLVSKTGLKRWHDGTLIQHALRDMAPCDREFLMNNICPECQKNHPTGYRPGIETKEEYLDLKFDPNSEDIPF